MESIVFRASCISLFEVHENLVQHPYNNISIVKFISFYSLISIDQNFNDIFKTRACFEIMFFYLLTCVTVCLLVYLKLADASQGSRDSVFVGVKWSRKVALKNHKLKS